MALVEIAQFNDLTEAQAAAAALRSAGMPVFVQNDSWGQTFPGLGETAGGVTLWVLEDDAADALGYIEGCRTRAEAAARMDGLVRTAVSLGVLAVLAPATAWMVSRRRRSRAPA